VLVRLHAVQLLAVEHFGTVDEIDPCLRLRQACGLHRIAQAVRAERERHVLQELHRPAFERAAGDRPMQRHEQAHVVTCRVQVLGQRAGDVGEAAGLRERRDFGSEEADPQGHRRSVPL
jgi:hypothetical protein